jgi:tetratricopeptide (TPR) repeat protein
MDIRAAVRGFATGRTQGLKPRAVPALYAPLKRLSSTYSIAVTCSMVGVLLCATGVAQQSSTSAVPAAPATQAASDPSPEFAEARKLMEQGKMDDAIAALQTVEARDPATKGLALELGTAYYKKSEFPKAIEYLKKATAADPENSEALQLLGLSYYLGGHPADAIPLLEKVQGWYPRANVDAAYILGICYIQTRDYDRARKAFGKMFDVPGDSAAAYLFTARMLLRQEYDPVAEQYAQKAAALDPKLPLVHFLLGELYLYKSRVPEAIAEFQKELAINPANAATYYKLADAYSRIQKFEDAERLLQRSIWLDATSTGPFILMGKVLEKKGEYDLAVRALQRAATMDPNNPTTHHLLGQAYRDMGKKEEAETELKLAEQLQMRQDSK